MGLAEIAMLASAAVTAGSQWWQASEQSQMADRHNRESRRREGIAGQFLTEGPSDLERLFQDILSGLEAPDVNITNDPIFQLLNADPGGQRMSDEMDILRGIATTGDPTDPSQLFGALDPMFRQERSDALAEVRGPVSGLGQRFGSAQRRSETDMLTRLMTQQNARREGMAADLSESSAGRRLTAAQALMQGALGSGQLDVQRAGAASTRARDLMNALLQSRAQQLGGFQSLLGAEQGRANTNMQLLSLMFGLPMAQSGFTPGQAAQETGSLLMYLPLLMQLMGSGGGGEDGGPDYSGLWALAGGA